MAYNVISCKKSDTVKKSKSLILLYKFGSRPQKMTRNRPKEGSLNRELTQFFRKGMTYISKWSLPTKITSFHRPWKQVISVGNTFFLDTFKSSG